MSYTTLYEPFFKDLIQRLNKVSRDLARHSAEENKSWVKICPKDKQYWFSCSFSNDGFRINLTFQHNNDRDNRDAVNHLRNQRATIEAELTQEGVDTNLLGWDHLETDRFLKGTKRRDICLIRREAAGRAPEILNNPQQAEEYKQWAVETIPPFVKVFHPKVEAYLRRQKFGW